MFKQAAQELTTVRDLLRFAVSRFNDAGLFFGHGSDNAHDEAAYLILHTLNLPLDTLEPYLDAKLLQSEKEEVLSILERRAVEHIPAAYLTHQHGRVSLIFMLMSALSCLVLSFTNCWATVSVLGLNMMSWYIELWICVPVAAVWPFKWRITIPTHKSMPLI